MTELDEKKPKWVVATASRSAPLKARPKIQTDEKNKTEN